MILDDYPGYYNLTYSCIHCGQNLKNDAKYCPNCGEKTEHYYSLIKARIQATWITYRQALTMYFCFLACLAPAVWISYRNKSTASFISYGLILIVITFFNKITKTKILQLVQLKAIEEKVQQIARYLLLIIPLLFMNFLWIFTLLFIFGIDIGYMVNQSMEMRINLIEMLILSCILAPIFEELAFRGIIQTTIAKATNKQDAWIITSIMFEIIHMRLLYFPFLLTSFYLGYLRKKFDSLIPGMIAHALYNLGAILVVINLHRIL